MLLGQGNLAGAEANFRRALELQPGEPVAHYNLGNVLHSQGRLDEAVEHYRQALRAAPTFAEAHNNLGNALQEQGRVDEAVGCFQRALTLRPTYVEAHYNLGNALAEQGRLDAAVTAYRRALDLRPAFAEAHYNLSLVLLRQGDFERGWSEYEWRWRCEHLPLVRERRPLAQPLWDGRPLRGQRLLLYAEQGSGDTLQFVRYVPLAAACGGQVVLECQPELKRLLEYEAGAVEVIARGERLPEVALQAALMSLPHLFGTTLSTIPARVPYLEADPRLVAAWGGRLPTGGRLRVGLVWAGRTGHPRNALRSMRLATLAPLAHVPGLAFVALQKGPAADEVTQPPPGMALTALGPLFTDFADTAAVVSQLDLVITVDTAVAHLAGALKRPVWVLLAHLADWRWLLDREDSPWYPTARLFRQKRPGDWDGVVACVTAALRELAMARLSRRKACCEC